MNKFTVIVFLVVVTLVAQSVQDKTKKRKKPPVPANDGSFSEKEHFHEGKHDAQYDHDAFLGEDQAKEMEKLSPKETKKRLRYVVIITNSL
jgi:hypothetical protein